MQKLGLFGLVKFDNLRFDFGADNDNLGSFTAGQNLKCLGLLVTLQAVLTNVGHVENRLACEEPKFGDNFTFLRVEFERTNRVTTVKMFMHPLEDCRLLYRILFTNVGPAFQLVQMSVGVVEVSQGQFDAHRLDVCDDV